MDSNRGCSWLFRMGVMAVLGVGGLAGVAMAGGALVPEPGDGWVSVGYASKTGDRRLDADGTRFVPGGGRAHDFRYGYVSGEVGLVPRLAVSWTSTYLWGTESFDDASRDFSHHGFSDQWLGLRYQVRRGHTPIVAEVNARLPYLYENGERWLGVLKHDFTGLVHVGRGFARGELNSYAGYTYRQGSPCNQLRLGAKWEMPLGSAVLGAPLRLNLGIDGFLSVGEPSSSEPSDRFSQRDRAAGAVNYFTFNDSSWARPYLSVLRPVGSAGWLEVGYGNIGAGGLGRSVHQYNELFASYSLVF